MEVRQAVEKAKEWVREVYADEQLTNLGLEEIKKDYSDDTWLITIGFSRPWDANRSVMGLPVNDKAYSRSLKIVTLDDKSGDVISIKKIVIKESLKLILDAQLIVLFVVGSYDRRLIHAHKRCNEFDETDFEVLATQLHLAAEIIVPSHAFAEASNLLRLIGEPEKSRLTEHFAQMVRGSRESYIRSVTAIQHEAYVSLRLTDSVLLSGRRDATLLTKDFDLYRSALAEGRRVINFTHLRERIAPRF